MKYDELMDKIEVTDAMRARILRNVSAAAPKKTPVRRYALLAACLAVVLLGAVCVPKLVEVASAAALADAVGFPAAEAAELPFDVEETTYTSYWGELAEICYAGGGQIADLRTSAGTEDNSGDYTDYPAVTELTVGTVTAELRGEAAERYTLAVGTDGQYAYSLRLSDGQSTEVWQRLLAGVRTEG